MAEERLSRISEAMARSRNAKSEAATIDTDRVEPRVSTFTGESRPRAAESGNIVYSRTRTVSISHERLKEHRIVTGTEPGPLGDAYKILSTQVLQRLREGGWNALAVTSPNHNTGKTLTAINLAFSLAFEVDQTVLLVDADLRAPSVHRYLDLPPGPGLADNLLSATPLADALVHPGIGRLVILPGGEAIANSAELLGSQKMKLLVQELKNRYPSRIVLFDLPPVLSAADALAFSPFVDAVLLVVEEGGTDREQLQRTAQMLQSTTVIGTVLNKSREDRALKASDAENKKSGTRRRLFRKRR